MRLPARCRNFSLGKARRESLDLRGATVCAAHRGGRVSAHARAFHRGGESPCPRPGRVLDLAGIGRAERAWPDTVFRWLRHRAGLELSITVLVTAEVIAKVYYAALHGATGCAVVRRLCEQICRDEVAHVHFQTERLARLRRGRRRWVLGLMRAAHRVFYFGTCLVVWHKHGRCAREGWGSGDFGTRGGAR
jgi:hypothetical protein